MNSIDKEKNNFYGELNKFGEYKYQNRTDTLFLFQLTFIVILVFIGLFYLNYINLFSTTSLAIITIILVIFIVLIYINRIVVDPKFRSKTDWNKYNFGDGTLTPPNNYTPPAGVVGGVVGSSPTLVCRTEPTEICTTT